MSRCAWDPGYIQIQHDSSVFQLQRGNVIFRVLDFFFQAIDGKQISSALEIYDQDNIYMKTRNPFKEMTIRFSLSTTTMKFASQYSDFYKSDRGIIGIFNQNLYQSVSHSKSLF